LGGRAPETELPVIVFPRRVDVLDHLGYRHITGIKEWTPLAKANYVRELLDRARERGEELSLSEAARMIGSKGWYVGRLLAALAAVEKLRDDKRFFASLGVEEEDLPFSLMLVALSRENIVDYLGLRTANSPDLPGLKTRELKRLATWLFKKRNGGKTALGESRNMTYLAQVVTSPDAMKALDDGQNVQAAAVLALDAHKILRVAVSESQEQVDLAIRQEPRLKNLRVDDLETVQTLRVKVDTLVTLVESKVRARRKR
jgi:hypothetical protein